MTNFGKEQLYFKFNVFCEEIPSVAKNNLLLRTFLSSSSSGVGRRESRRINFALKLELLRYFIIGWRFHHFFPSILKCETYSPDDTSVDLSLLLRHLEVDNDKTYFLSLRG